MMWFNDTPALVSHFASSPREREKRDGRDSKRDEKRDREERGTGVKVKKPLPATRIVGLAQL